MPSLGIHGVDARVSVLMFARLRRFRFGATIVQENYGDPAYTADPLRMTYDAHF